MNTNGLAKMYDKLTPWERVPMVLAARARGDDSEVERLVWPARRPVHCKRLEHGLYGLSEFYHMSQLDCGVIYHRAAALVGQEPFAEHDKKGEKRSDRLWHTMRFLAWRMVAEADAWKLFCEGLNIDPDLLLRDAPGFETVQEIVEEARAVAYTPTQATAFHRQKMEAPEDGETLPTAETLASAMREVLEQYVRGD